MNPVFVFGSNLAGVHGAGAAAFALKYRGAIWGRGEGIQGDSYGIPTKDERIESLPLDAVKGGVTRFLQFAQVNPQLTFRVTAIGCGLAGFTREQIIPMFAGAPCNCFFFEPAFGQPIEETA
jgi:hypothetical protein